MILSVYITEWLLKKGRPMRFANTTRLQLLMIAIAGLSAGCSNKGVTVSLEDSASANGSPASSGRAELGVAHVAGTYSLTQPGDSFLVSGAQQILALGSSTIKLYLTPEYQQKYPEMWPNDIHRLAELAQTPAFSKVLGMPFKTYVITAYSFAMGTSDVWRTQSDPALLAAEASELTELAELLLRTYSGSGKTFILQNWEGDWALLGGNDPSASIPADRMQRMIEWLNNRQTAIAKARAEVGEKGVAVLNAVEVNRVLDAGPDRPRVVTAVLPSVSPDAVSYSAWEALEIDPLQSMAETTAGISTKLRSAVSLIRANAGGSARVYLGEFGFAENELDSAHLAGFQTLLETVVTSADELNLSDAIYWQLYDNECKGPGVSCQGFWVVRPDGSLSHAGEALKALL